MRFKVSYRLSKLPMHYRMSVYSLIKQAIRLENSQYYDKLFTQSKNKIQSFSFSTFLHNFSFHDTMIHLDKITITISSPDMEFFVTILNGIPKIKEFKVNDEVWVQSQIQLLHEPNITSRKARFKTNSPILIEDKNGKPLSPRDSAYETELNYYANSQIQQFAKRNLYEPLKFTPIKMIKTVIKERNRHLNPESYLYFTTFRGTFILEGNLQDLQLLYQLGLGKRTAYFGLLDYEGEGVKA
ncbi:CRISPR-associated endoribonuclease Cas6 [Bacillus canaveralius]|uniref:CRISPR-associated endoribonuclease Cas6 n=1 Tax=Bacillus canaveralius TaxID=1403243 RepID=UPI000F79CEF0|nr:CRISPR-associated endoribonuclease Cas6 [Bacillus canaveralius]RSK53988.1 CRISPR-associated endoribonuclease Cas6 [Bacillus canaveralius]